jgi:hypothetical protein
MKGESVVHDPPGGSYLDAILSAIRGAGQRIEAVGGYLGSAERAASPGWKWQLLSAAGQAHADALERLDEAEERLLRLGSSDELPAPLDQLPKRLTAMRDELRAAADRIEHALASALSSSAGSA